jgi:hypothetical protein
MINVSNEFRKEMATRTDFKQNAEITFTNGTVLELTEQDFTIDNNGVSDGADTNGIPLGVALSRSIQIEIMNDDDRFSSYDFFGAVIHLYLTFKLSETVERIEYGTFTVMTPETYGETVIITALDDMYKADKKYTTKISYPATIKSILVDACNTLGIPLGTTTFKNESFIVNAIPEDITFRQMIGYIAMMAGGNARIDTSGRLRIISYDFEKINDLLSVLYDGGQFNPWTNNTNLDGGSFDPWNSGDVADGGIFGDRDNLHILGNWINLKVDTDDVVITGVLTNYTDDNNQSKEIIFGEKGYVLELKNPLFAGKEEEALNLIGRIMIGGKFRQFSGDMVSDPTVEFMDVAAITDRKGNTYISVITDVNFQFFGFTSVKNSAEPAMRNSSKIYSQSVQVLTEAKKIIKKEQTAREMAISQLAKDLANSSGLYITTENQPDGSSIYYMHDKTKLSESSIIWKLTSLAFAISTDGGKTYPYGFTVDGEAVTRLLYAQGINADYINTGALNVYGENGTILFSADFDTKKVRINADNVLIGSQNVRSYIDSAISVATDAIRLEVTERTSMYNEQVNSLQGGMDGNVDLSFFEGTGEIVNINNKQAIFNNGYALYQDISLPAGTYLFTYEWLRNGALYINSSVALHDMSISSIPSYSNTIYSKDLGSAWPTLDTWTKESFEFTLDKTKRIRFVTYFEAPWDYPDRPNSLYLTNLTIFGTAQSVSDAIADVKSELIVQSDKIEAKVEKNGVIGAINLTSEEATIQAKKIDLVGLVSATEFTSKFATINSLNAVEANLSNLISDKATIKDLDAATADIENLKSNKIDASVVKADYMEVVNWTSGGYIRADKIDADEIVSRISQSAEIRAGFIGAPYVSANDTLYVGGYGFHVEYSSTLHAYILKGEYAGA